MPVVGAALAIGLTLLVAPTSDYPWLYLMVAVMGLSVAVPMWIQWRRGTLDPYEMIHVVGFLYFIYFGLGAIWTVSNPDEIAYDRDIPNYIQIAAFQCMLGQLAMQLGYWGVWRKRRRSPARELVPLKAGAILVPVGIGVFSFFAAFLLDLGISLPGVGPALTSSLSQLAPTFAFSWALVWLLALGDTRQAISRTVLLGAAIPATVMIMGFAFRDKSLLVTMIGIPLTALWYGRRKLPIVPGLVVLLITIFAIFPFVNHFRNYDYEIPFGQRWDMTVTEIGEWSADEYWRRSAETFQGRMALINSVAVVNRDVGRWVPFAHGETIVMPFLTLTVPRPLWPDKPVYTFGREFGVLFRVVGILDTETRISPTVPGELYWNFGMPGVVIGMLLWGIAMRWFYRRYAESRNLDPINRAMSVLVLVEMVHYGGGLAFNTVHLLRTVLIVELMLWFFRYIGWVGWRPAVPLFARRSK